MKTLRRLNRISDAHPLISIIAGFVAIVIVGMLLFPADGPDVVAVAAPRSAAQ